MGSPAYRLHDLDHSSWKDAYDLHDLTYYCSGGVHMCGLAYANMFAGCGIDDLNLELGIAHWPRWDLVRLGAHDLSDV